MTLAIYIYLISVVTKFGDLLEIIAVTSMLSIVVLCAISGVGAMTEEDWWRDSLKRTKWFIVAFLVTGLLGTLTPNEKTMYMMAGGYAAQSVVESEIGDKVYTLINQELDKLITQEK